MNQPIYHETSAAIYFDNGDGSLTVKQKRNVKIRKTIATFKNDNLGRLAYQNFRKTLVNNENIYCLYRCPNDGRTYAETNPTSGSRHGSISKKFAKVMTVLQSNR